MDPATVQGITSYLENENSVDTPVNVIESRNLSSSFKITSSGKKVIRIEIYDAVQFDSVEKSICRCNARLCTQHVVQDLASDNIYHRIREIIKCIDNNFYKAL